MPWSPNIKTGLYTLNFSVYNSYDGLGTLGSSTDGHRSAWCPCCRMLLLLLKDRWGRGYLHEPITTYFAVQDCNCVAISNNTINLSKLVDGKNKTSAG